MKKILLGLTCFCILNTFSLINVHASEYIVIDNDPLSSSQGTCTNQDGAFSYGKGSYDYNGDYRIGTPGRSGEYAWEHKTYYYEKKPTVSFRVFLHNSKFTCPKAAYYGTGGTLYSDGFLCFINQNTAPGGWSYIARNWQGTYNFKHGGNVFLPQCSGGGQVGADAFELIVPN